MVRTTPGSHPGYLRYLLSPGVGWYDRHMADEFDRAREHPEEHGDFAEGQETEPEPPDQEKIRDFGEGQELDPDTPEEEHVGRFSEGQEEEPETPEKEVERRFSEGQEEGPDST
jgi:hypothetical protein